MPWAPRRADILLAHGTRGLLAVGAALSALSLLPLYARADCSLPPFEVLWTYPENGAVDVPTNAVLHDLSTTWGVPRVTLDGVDVPAPQADRREGIPLGALLPNHDYVLQLDYGLPSDGDAGAAKVARVAFRTGAGPATVPPPATVSTVHRGSSPDASAASPCPNVVAAQDCFDMGQNTLLTFDVPETSGPGYTVDGELWPARCGDPSLFVYEDATNARCHDVRVIGAGGLLSEPTRACPAPSSDAGAEAFVGADASPAVPQPATATAAPNDDSDSCAVSPRARERSLSVWLLLGVASLFARRRARRSVET